MFTTLTFFSLIFGVSAIVAGSPAVGNVVKRQTAEAFVSPLDGGGSMLTNAGTLGEPLNVRTMLMFATARIFLRQKKGEE